jgi:hypothetical protein
MFADKLAAVRGEETFMSSKERAQRGLYHRPDREALAHLILVHPQCVKSVCRECRSSATRRTGGMNFGPSMKDPVAGLSLPASPEGEGSWLQTEPSDDPIGTPHGVALEKLTQLSTQPFCFSFSDSTGNRTISTYGSKEAWVEGVRIRLAMPWYWLFITGDCGSGAVLWQ